MSIEHSSYEDLARLMLRQLPYEPTEQQTMVLAAMARFLTPLLPDPRTPQADRAFILRGYAGTGKTSMVGAIVRTLQSLSVPVMLMAPTGRAAKVFASYAGCPAYTIHRKIYRHFLGGGGGGKPPLQENRLRGAVFIIDEASMISGQQGDDLLHDLLQYVYAGDSCRLILLGDTAQLPPVGCDTSPAMVPDVLRHYGIRVSSATITHTVRQTGDSGILLNATALRRAMRQTPLPSPPPLSLAGHPDVRTVPSEDLPEVLDACYRQDGGIADTILITRSNQKATLFNRAIRSDVLYHEDTLCRGDLLLVGKNNYFWPTRNKTKGLDFLANGDIVRVSDIYGTEVKYGFIFADVRVTILDSDTSLDCKVITETLLSDTPALSSDRLTALYQRIITDPDRWDPSLPYDMRARQMQTDPYWNALQMKYAYAVTCHKAQGGQWSNVVVDLSYIPPDAVGLDLYRWLYTAVTRARGCLYLLNADTLCV